MLTIYDSHHIPTNRHRKGHMALRTHTGFFAGRREARRVNQAYVDLVNRRLRLDWLVRLWAEHQAWSNLVREEKYI